MTDQADGRSEKMRRTISYALIEAVLAAILFGASTPLAKLLLGEVEPIPLAAFLYLGSGLGLVLIKGGQRLRGRMGDGEARIRRSDLPWLIGATVAGGIAAPIALMFGLRATPASTASLLLNFEGVATSLIARLAFREAVGRRAWWAIAAITLASIVLSWEGGQWGIAPGMLAVLGACVLWGVDNNLTHAISTRDPLTIVTVKGLTSGAFSLVLALMLDNPLPALPTALETMALGGLCYGLSIVLFVRAMRGLGAARTSALFGTAPFVGTVLSFPLFRETISVKFLIALPLMIAGMILLVREEHAHFHAHGAIKHEHRHRHDDGHHIHTHRQLEWDPSQSHAHVHVHERLKHTHTHAPDVHHRHVHQPAKERIGEA